MTGARAVPREQEVARLSSPIGKNATCLVPGDETILGPHTKPNGDIPMKRYIIERDVPGVGDRVMEHGPEVAARSNHALSELGGKAQWEHSYVVDDKTFCVYMAEGEDAILEHAKLSGFPASKITEVRTIIDPDTANR